MQETCETCKFMKPDDLLKGRCHRHPPQFEPDWDWEREMLGGDYYFPKIENDDWCGEWRESKYKKVIK